MFHGAAQLSLDGKGRMAIPTRQRDALAIDGGRLALTAHPDKCLLLYRESDWLPIRDRLSALPSMDREARRWQLLLIGMAQELAADAAGRIMIPKELRTFARLSHEVMFVGQARHFEIWDLDAWNAQLDALTLAPPNGPLSPALADIVL
jgi:MraZ protein